MNRKSLASIQKRIVAALIRETREDVRKQLLALQAVFKSHTPEEAAQIANVSIADVKAWVDSARQRRWLSALLAKPPRVPREFDRRDAASHRAAIAAAFDKQLTLPERRRLRAIDAFLAGQPIEAAAQAAGFEPETLRVHLRRREQYGIERVMPRNKQRATRSPTRKRDPRNELSSVSVPVRKVILANRKRRKDFAALGFAEGELKDALANEHRPAKRRRLLGLKALLDGHTEVEAAKLADTSPNSIVRWRKLLLNGGLGAVLTDATRAKPMNPELVANIRTEIAVALAQEPPPRARLRLTGIDAALAGVPLDKAAALAQVKLATLNQWLREVRLRGIEGLLPKPRRADQRPKIDADPARLHALAASEQDRYVRKRLLGLAYVAEGFSINDAAIRATLGVTTLVKHLHLFQQGGIAAICSNPRRGPSPRLRPKELQVVSRLLRTPPVMAAEQMCAYIEAEFGVRYTPNGLRGMLKKQFGFVYGAAPRPS